MYSCWLLCVKWTLFYIALSSQYHSTRLPDPSKGNIFCNCRFCQNLQLLLLSFVCVLKYIHYLLQMKTVSVALVMCLNVGVDPPDVVKTSPCARLECWIGKQGSHKIHQNANIFVSLVASVSGIELFSSTCSLWGPILQSQLGLMSAQASCQASTTILSCEHHPILYRGNTRE